ncbi:hypothetical protein ACIGO8_14965 [Streptomyces sp. NPDC053493]|uniref:hypothetical protein n=1 Tax=Streptomyces sp. NPDC053493 TaxID=3365705 RepID=UPI0037D7DAFB
MRANRWMRDLLAEADLTGLSPADVPPGFRDVVAGGWSVTASGARVLTALHAGPGGAFFDRLAEETTVNGRGMTDHDLPAGADTGDGTGDGPGTGDGGAVGAAVGAAVRAHTLLRRCLAYAAGCLRAAEETFGDDAVRAYVVLSPDGTDDGLLTATVTFCTPLPDVPPYIADLEEAQDAAVAEISVRDRPGPAPDARSCAA